MIPKPRGILALAAVALLAFGCSAEPGGAEIHDPSGFPSVERVVVGDFDKLQVAHGFQVQVRDGAESQATVSASGIPAEQIQAVVDGGTLVLSTTTGSVPRGANLKAAVVAPALSGVTAASGAKIVLLQGLALGANDANINLTAGADFEGEISADSFDAVLQAGARAQVRGAAQAASIVGSESGMFDGAEFAVADAKVRLSSGSTAELTVDGTLDVSLSSGSQLIFGGSPRVTQSDVESGSTLTSKDQ
jgi:hypothetical protein